MRLGPFLCLPLLLALAACDRNTEDVDRPFIIDEHVVWGGPGATVQVTRDVRVVEGAVLEIMAGTTVEIVAGSVRQDDPAGDFVRTPRFTIEGQLLSMGREDGPVTFTVVDGEEGDLGYYDVRIFSGPAPAPQSLVLWTRMDRLQWNGGNVVIQASIIDEVTITEADSLLVEFNILDVLSIDGGSGVVRDNNIDDGLTLFRSTARIEHNTFTNMFRGILSGFGARNDIVRNIFRGCETAIEIFEGEPHITQNNFIDNGVHLAIRPNSGGGVEPGTIDAVSNWWGTTDLADIERHIQRLTNGSVTSQRGVVIEPISLLPYLLD